MNTSLARGRFTQGLLELPELNYTTYFGRNRTAKVDFILYGVSTLSKDINHDIMNLSAKFIDDILDD